MKHCLFVMLCEQHKKDLHCGRCGNSVYEHIVLLQSLGYPIPTEFLSNTSMANWYFKGTHLTINQCFLLVVMYYVERTFLCFCYRLWVLTYWNERNYPFTCSQKLLGMKERTIEILASIHSCRDNKKEVKGFSFIPCIIKQ